MGHHGIFSNSGTADTLVTGFEISGTFVHDTSVVSIGWRCLCMLGQGGDWGSSRTPCL